MRYWFDDCSTFWQADLDAIVVATPAPVHVPCGIEAMRNGKHVLSEVPACYDQQQAHDLVAAVEAAPQLRYMLAESMRHYAWVQEYRDMIHQGILGEVIYAEGEYIHDLSGLWYDQDGNLTWRTKLPPTLCPTHDLGRILQIIQDGVVTAVRMSTASTWKCGSSRPRRGTSSRSSTASRWPRSPRLPDGKHLLWLDEMPSLTRAMELPLGTNHRGAPPEATLGGHGTSDFYMVDDFVRCILDDSKPAIDVYEGLDQTLPGVCAHRSAESGSQPEEVPDLRPGKRRARSAQADAQTTGSRQPRFRSGSVPVSWTVWRRGSVADGMRQTTRRSASRGTRRPRLRAGHQEAGAASGFPEI